jgi:fructose-1,6-bisphosphatase/inositol monophosphatase family enzyme
MSSGRASRIGIGRDTLRSTPVLDLLHDVADAVKRALDDGEDWRPRTDKLGQYAIDVVADAAALRVLDEAGVGVLSEESGLRRPDHQLLVVVDPVDGSTNASRRIPWYATSLCVLDGDGPAAALVVNQATGERFAAVRGEGATLDGQPITPSTVERAQQAIVGLSGWPPVPLGWKQFRALGAAALDLCLVAAGRLDAYVDCSANAHGPWDYLGALLVLEEAGAQVVDVHGRDLVARAHGERRTPVAAATPALLDELVTARRRF